MYTILGIRSVAMGAVLAVAAMVALACSGGSDGGSSDTVKLGTLRQPHLHAPSFYQDFMPEGAKVEITYFANSTEIKNAVIKGDIDFAVTGITAALEGAAQNEPIRVLAAAADGGSVIVARTDRDINSVQDLRGKKIGYVAGSAQDILLRLTLQGAGLNAASDVELIRIGFADMANALERGDIDAFAGAETGPSDAIVRGNAKALVYPYETPMRKINIIFATSQKMIDDNPDLVATMVEVHAKATDYLMANPDVWGKSVVDSFGFEPESLNLAIKNITLRWQIDDAYIAQTRILGEQLRQLQQIRSEPNYEAFFNTTFVDDVMREAVSDGR